MEWQMLIYLNRDRKEFGLSSLKMQKDLRNVARNHSRDMAKQEYFEHENLKGQSPADRLQFARVTDATSGENLAKIGGYDRSVWEAENGLMHSPGHRANILNKEYNCVGIGIIKSKDGVFYFTQNFAKRLVRFSFAPAKRVSLKKGLRLKGVSLEKVSNVYFQVRMPGVPGLVQDGFERLGEKGEFDFVVFFEETGVYEVLLFTVDASSKEKNLSNTFEVTVKSWWFWF